MKTTIRQLSKSISAKAGLDIEVNTFNELKTVLKDLVPVIRFDDSNEDMDTTSLDAMTQGYFSCTAGCYTPEIRIAAQKDVLAKLMTVIKSDWSDFETLDGSYDDLSDIPDDDVVWRLMDYGKMSDVFEQLRIFSENDHVSFVVMLTNITPENDDKDIIRYQFDNGKRTGGGKIFIKESDTSWYPMFLYWLCYAFADMTMNEVESLNIQIEVM